MKKFSYQNPQMLFKGQRVNLLSIDVPYSNGKVLKRQIIDHPGAVVVLPLLKDGRVVLIQNKRHAIQETLWELPAGTLEKGEEPLECAKRELVEETGFASTKVSPLHAFYSTPGFCNEILYAFVAEDLEPSKVDPDEEEEIEVSIVDWQQALKMVQDRTIQDMKTIALILYYQAFYKN